MIVRCNRCGRQLFAPAGALGNCPGCGAPVESVATAVDVRTPAPAGTEPVAAPHARYAAAAAAPAHAAEPAHATEPIDRLAGYAPNNGWQAHGTLAPDFEEVEAYERARDYRRLIRMARIVGVVVVFLVALWLVLKLGLLALPATHRKWEYNHITANRTGVRSALDVAGNDGWELVSAVLADPAAGTFELILKRPRGSGGATEPAAGQAPSAAPAAPAAPTAAAPAASGPAANVPSPAAAPATAHAKEEAGVKKSDLRRFDKVN